MIYKYLSKRQYLDFKEEHVKPKFLVINIIINLPIMCKRGREICKSMQHSILDNLRNQNYCIFRKSISLTK